MLLPLCGISMTPMQMSDHRHGVTPKVETRLGETTLRSGERMSIIKTTAPEPAWTERIVAYLAHKGDLWLAPMRRAYNEGLDNLVMSDFLGVLDGGEIVGNITTVEHLGVAIVQHVCTPERHRRKGICSALMQAVSDDFRARGVRAAYLSTDHDSPAYRIYQRFGFRGRGDSGKMTWLLDEGFEGSHFARGETVIRQTRWEDWPLLEALYCVGGQWQLKSFHFQLIGHANYEAAYLQLRQGMEEGSVLDVRVMQKSDGAVVGHAALAVQRLWKGRPLVLDCMAHANFHDRVPALLEAVGLPAGRKVQAFCDGQAEAKMAGLEALGFAREGVFEAQIEDEKHRPLDVVVYGRLT